MAPLAWKQTRSLLHAGTTPVIGLALSVLACSSEKEEKPATPEAGFAVSDFYAATGAMGDAAASGHLVIHPSFECKERPAGAVGDCYAFDYIAGPELWAGLYWLSPNNNWGTSPGLAVPGDKLTKVRFQAAVEEGTDELLFVIGGIGVPPLPEGTPTYPYADQMKQELRVDVTTSWQTFEIPIPKQSSDGTTPITELIGAFAWSAYHPDGIDPTTAPTKTVYIDDLAYE